MIPLRLNPLYCEVMKYVLALCFAGLPAFADPPVIEQAKAEKSAGSWRFDVTVSHPDTGWDHYADGWRVLGPDGAELGMRILHHPHETEQPFTRSLGGIAIPNDVDEVQIQSRCSVDGWSNTTVTVALP